MRKRDLGGLLLAALVVLVLVGAGAAEGGGAGSPTLDFGSVPVNTSSTLSDTITVDAGYTISTTAPTGITAPFSVSFGTCAGAAGVGAGACMIQASFAPTATGSPSTALTLQECPTVSGGSCMNLPTIGLQGSAITTASANPATLDFGSVPVNTSSTLSDTITVDAGYAISTSAPTGVAAPFSVSFGTCAGTAGTGAGMCAIQATFAPTATGSPSTPLTLQECPTGGWRLMRRNPRAASGHSDKQRRRQPPERGAGRLVTVGVHEPVDACVRQRGHQYDGDVVVDDHG